MDSESRPKDLWVVDPDMATTQLAEFLNVFQTQTGKIFHKVLRSWQKTHQKNWPAFLKFTKRSMITSGHYHQKIFHSKIGISR